MSEITIVSYGKTISKFKVVHIMSGGQYTSDWPLLGKLAMPDMDVLGWHGALLSILPHCLSIERYTGYRSVHTPQLERDVLRLYAVEVLPTFEQQYTNQDNKRCDELFYTYGSLLTGQVKISKAVSLIQYSYLWALRLRKLVIF